MPECVLCESGYATYYSWLALANSEPKDVCDDCYDERLVHRCNSCDGVVGDSQLTDGYCPLCASERGIHPYGGDESIPIPRNLGIDEEPPFERSIRQRRLHSWDYTPPLTFYKMPYEKSELLFLGMELEACHTGADYEGDLRTVLAQLPEWAYAKRDSSIEPGMELVTHPMTMRYLSNNLTYLDAYMKLLRENYFNAFESGRAGMHIHMNLAAFGTMHLWRMMKFIYDNYELSRMLSQRSDSSMDQWANMNVNHRHIVSSVKEKRAFLDHHTAVNISGHSSSVEIRLYRGTLNPLALRRNIEIAYAMYCYTQDISANDMSLPGWVEYVRINRGLFSTLNYYFDLPKAEKILFEKDEPPPSEVYEQLTKVQSAKTKKNALVLSL